MRRALTGARRIVVKLGTSVVTHEDGRLDYLLLEALASDVASLRSEGRRVTIVTSGAVGAGMPHLSLNAYPASVMLKQASAAVGQIQLMSAYRQAFAHYGCQVAQVLLTATDLHSREGYLNARNTLATLGEHGIIPLVNENDTVAIEELSLSDNDRLAGFICDLVEADGLVLLSDIDGLYDRNPKVHPDAVRHSVIDANAPEIAAWIDDSQPSRSRGGMASKLRTVRRVANQGTPCIIASGKRHRLPEILSGADVGTFFPAGAASASQRDRWLGAATRPQGTLQVDAGAALALRERGSSLLPAGLVGVEGTFQRGEVVAVIGPQGEVIGRGLVNYPAEDARSLIGAHSENIARILGASYGDELIHRNNFCLETDHDAP